MKNSAPFLGLIMLFLTFPVLCQEDRTEDSLVVVLPEKVTANLDLIVPPDGFEPTDKFNGYLHAQASSGIIMTMIDNANYMKISEGMTEEFFAKNSLTFIEKSDFVSNNSVNGVYFKCSFVTGDTQFIRYIVYAGDLNKTLWLNITYPIKLEHLVEQEILNCIQTVTLKTSRDEK